MKALYMNTKSLVFDYNNNIYQLLHFKNGLLNTVDRVMEVLDKTICNITFPFTEKKCKIILI